MTNFEFYNGKVIWITGASSGIGEELARQLSAYNTRLILSSRRKEELERVKASLNGNPDNIYILPLDLVKPASLPELAEEAGSAFGRIDILINNGGVSQRSLTMETSIETDRKIMEINYFSGIILAKSLLPSMLVRRSGHFVAISSVAGLFGFPLRSAYAASKHAMKGFYETLGAEYYDQGIMTTMVYPGRIRTNISLGALGPDGKPANVMDPGQQKGTAVEACARDILNGIRKNKRDIYPGGREVLMVYFKKYLPWLSYRLARKVKSR